MSKSAIQPQLATALPSSGSIEPGVYFGLTNEVYHSDPALGSTNLRALLRNPSEYWWESWMNPAKKEKPDTKDAIRGTAAHTYILDGKEKFDASYMRRPDDPEGASPADKSAVTKEANKRAAAQGKTCLHADDYDRILTAAKLVLANPELNDAFVGGIPEISVFWVRDGVPLKARFDYSKVRAITDLKSIKNLLKTEFRECCLRTIAQRELPMQAEHYLDGREQMRKLALEGRIFGVDHDTALFKRIVDSEEWAFGWVFYQADGAPLTWGKHVSRGNPLLDRARDQIDKAIRRYRKCLQKYGTDMWAEIEPFEELYMEEIINVCPWFGRK